MSDIDWAALAEPFPDSEIKQRPGRGGMSFSYVDARAVAQRLDDVLTPAGWDFTWTHEGEYVVHGRLIVGGSVKEEAGYPNSDSDEEPMKSAVSDALKRCAVQFGVGRHLYHDKPATGRSAAPQRPIEVLRAPARASGHVVDTSLDEIDDEENPFDDPTSTAPIVRPEEERCPWHPNREPKQGKYGLYCSGQGGNGPLNGKGYCDYKFNAA